jgi:hypothetical protein
MGNPSILRDFHRLKAGKKLPMKQAKINFTRAHPAKHRRAIPKIRPATIAPQDAETVQSVCAGVQAVDNRR